MFDQLHIQIFNWISYEKGLLTYVENVIWNIFKNSCFQINCFASCSSIWYELYLRLVVLIFQSKINVESACIGIYRYILVLKLQSCNWVVNSSTQLMKLLLLVPWLSSFERKLFRQIQNCSMIILRILRCRLFRRVNIFLNYPFS